MSKDSRDIKEETIIEEAFNKDGPGSESAVKAMARRRGLNLEATLNWWRENGPKPDAKKGVMAKQGREQGHAIFSQRPGGWQFDTVIPKRNANGKYYLWFVNVNTKETRAYEMPKKDSSSVKYAMQQFLLDTKNNKNNPRPVYSLTSDEDPAYATEDLLKFYEKNGIKYRTTTGTSKHILGIVNRNIKMIRDRIKNTGGLVDENGNKGTTGDMPKDEVNRKIAGWNTQPNEKLGGHSPVELTNNENKELDYIANRMNQADERREQAMKGIEVGMNVRRFKLGPKAHAEGNLDPYTWKVHYVDKLRGKVWLGRTNKDEGLVQVPRYQILADQSYQRGRKVEPDFKMLRPIPEEIVDSKNGVYTVRMSNKKEEQMTQRQLRGNRPLNKLQIEQDYEDTHKPKESTTHMTTRSRAKNKKI